MSMANEVMSSCVAWEQLVFEAGKLLIYLLISYSSKNKAFFLKTDKSFLVLITDFIFFSYLNWDLVCSVSVWHVGLKAVISQWEGQHFPKDVASLLFVTWS